MWITTDKDGDKFIFDKKPERLENVWDSDCDSLSLDQFPFKDNLPSFIQQQQWKDAPIQIKFEIKKK